MTCDCMWERISAHLDGQNTPEEEAALQAHLSVCEDCRKMLAAMEAAELSAASLEEQAPPRLKENVMAAVKQEQREKAEQKRRWKRLLPGGAIGAVAAVLALLVGTGAIPLRQLDAAPEKSSSVAYAPETEAAAEAYGWDGATGAPEAAAEDWLQNSLTVGAPEDGNAYEGLLWAETAAPEATDVPAENDVEKRSGPHHRPASLFSPEQLDRLQSLSVNADCAVLAYEGLGESFLEELCVLEPAFLALLEDTSLTEEDGMYVVRTDVGTAFAIHEWLTQVLSEDELSDALQFSRVREYDPDSECLTTVITMPRRGSLSSLPPDWQTDFAERFREGTNWALFYPAEDYSPARDDAACLVLLPQT